MNQRAAPRLPYLGFGLRLRREYLAPVLAERPPVDWFEVITESFLDDPEGQASLERIREHHPLVLHGISLAIGSPWPLDRDYLERLRRLIDRIEPAWVSDHLCWSGADDTQGSLLPLPYSRDMLEHLLPRIDQVQEALGRPILLENVPMERLDREPEIPEPEFIAEVAERSGSLILLDVANLHSTAVNRGIDTDAYLQRLPDDRVQQIHLAGAVALCEPELDHSEIEEDPVWELYTGALERFGPISTMIERTDTIPPLEELVEELAIARCAVRRLLSRD